jgi:hypothetical protein
MASYVVPFYAELFLHDQSLSFERVPRRQVSHPQEEEDESKSNLAQSLKTFKVERRRSEFMPSTPYEVCLHSEPLNISLQVMEAAQKAAGRSLNEDELRDDFSQVSHQGQIPEQVPEQIPEQILPCAIHFDSLLLNIKRPMERSLS